MKGSELETVPENTYDTERTTLKLKFPCPIVFSLKRVHRKQKIII